MGLTLELRYASAADLLAQLTEHADKGALLLPMAPADLPPALSQYAPVVLQVRVGDRHATMGGEVLQVLQGSGVVVQLTDTSAAQALTQKAAIVAEPLPPEVHLSPPEPGGDSDAAAPTKPKGGPHMVGSSAVSWSLEQLQASWDQLNLSEKVRVARHGKRAARQMILKGMDKTLHVHVLRNPGVTADEIAMMAAMSNLDPQVLRSIADDNQWTRHKTVARNLICNPKLTLPQITKLLKFLPPDELERLARRGKVSQSVKQHILRTIKRNR